MRCAIKYSYDKTFYEQTLEAWGEMQSIGEDPCYKENELNAENKVIFNAYKVAMDDAITNYETLHEDNEQEVEKFKDLCAGDVCLLLFSLLDEQEG